MANTFKRYTSTGIGTGATTVYTVPASKTAIVIGFNIANVTSGQVSVDLQTAGMYLAKSVPLPANSGLSPLDGKIVLETGDTIIVTANAASSVDAIISVMEQDNV
jgi:hypothetical protein